MLVGVVVFQLTEGRGGSSMKSTPTQAFFLQTTFFLQELLFFKIKETGSDESSQKVELETPR